MRIFTSFCTALMLGSVHLFAQVVSTFDDLSLPHADTFYVNYSVSGTDVGFNDGLVHFPCVYDTSYGGFWTTGFAYSNMTDSVTSGFMNQYSAKAGRGYDSSANYAVAYCFDPITFENKVNLRLTGPAAGHPVNGFYVTNNTYAFNSMRDGDMFARKFHNGDWFKLTVRGYSAGALLPDSVGVYLADFLFPDTTMNYILRNWQWVNTSSLGSVDSLQFSLTSTDNGMYGMNTPAYFCIDNVTVNNPALTVHHPSQPAARMYPNPTTGTLYVDISDNSVDKVVILNMLGEEVIAEEVGHRSQLLINTAPLPAGQYVLRMSGANGEAAAQFVKK